MACHRSSIVLLFIFVTLIALVFVFLALIAPLPAVAQSILKTKTRVEAGSGAAIFSGTN
jgi:hypothetical protein